MTKAKISCHPSPKILQALSIETTLAKNYEKLRKQLKKHNFVKCNDYKVIIAKLEVNLYTIEDIILKGQSKLKKLIVMSNSS